MVGLASSLAQGDQVKQGSARTRISKGRPRGSFVPHRRRRRGTLQEAAHGPPCSSPFESSAFRSPSAHSKRRLTAGADGDEGCACGLAAPRAWRRRRVTSRGLTAACMARMAWTASGAVRDQCAVQHQPVLCVRCAVRALCLRRCCVTGSGSKPLSPHGADVICWSMNLDRCCTPGAATTTAAPWWRRVCLSARQSAPP
jgi:hypothetical protein